MKPKKLKVLPKEDKITLDETSTKTVKEWLDIIDDEAVPVLIKQLYEIAQDTEEPGPTRIKSCELLLAYVLGTPQPQPPAPPQTKPFVIQHNVISIDDVKQLVDDRNKLKE